MSRTSEININISNQHTTTRNSITSNIQSTKTFGNISYTEGTNTDFAHTSPESQLILKTEQGKGTLFWEVIESSSGNPNTYQETIKISIDNKTDIDLLELSSGLYIEWGERLLVKGRAGNYALNARVVTVKLIMGT